MKRNKNKGPEFRFMAFFNRWGVALASTIPGSILRISQEPPVALVYNPNSGFNWENTANEFQTKILSELRLSLNEVVLKFNVFINEKNNSPASLGLKEEEVLFIGYDSGEIYPSMMSFDVNMDSEGKVIFEKNRERHINIKSKAFISLLGKYNYILPLIRGISDDFESALRKQLKNRILKLQEKLYKKSLYLNPETKSIDADEEYLLNEFSEIIKKSNHRTYKEVLLGLDSFSIQDMGDAIKNLMDAESRFSYLKHKNKGAVINGEYERAVMTVPEGFTWIKPLKSQQS